MDANIKATNFICPVHIHHVESLSRHNLLNAVGQRSAVEKGNGNHKHQFVSQVPARSLPSESMSMMMIDDDEGEEEDEKEEGNKQYE